VRTVNKNGGQTHQVGTNHQAAQTQGGHRNDEPGEQAQETSPVLAGYFSLFHVVSVRCLTFCQGQNSFGRSRQDFVVSPEIIRRR
jgi:hypothetical protein